MSFAGGTGHKSPFGERAKSTKSPLSVKRNGSVGVSRAAQRGVRHSLFAREPPTSSPTAKVGQWRSAQAEVNEPTTPTKLSEGGGATDTFRRERAAGREDFSKFPKGKVVTPVKTLRPAFGSTPPRSPKRPYLRSPKCQKVLLERPAFYNVPADGLKIDPPNKEVTIAELQERLKKFLGEENALRRSQEGPFTICLSPNPLYRYDSLPAATEDNGAVKAEQQEVVTSETEQDELPPHVDASSSACLEAAMESHISVDDFTEGNSTESDGSENSVEKIDPAVQLEGSPVEVHAILEEERIEGDSAVETCNSASDDVIPEATAISQDSISSVPEHSNFLVEDEIENEDAAQLSSTVPETTIGETEAVVADSQQAQNCVSESSSGNSSEELILESGTSSRISAADNLHESEVIHHGSTVETDEKEEFDEELQVSWPVRLVKFLLSAIMVTCLMGAVVLGSGSPGLLPKSLHANPLAMKWAEVVSTPALSAKLLPTSVGIMGLGTEIDDIPFLQPLVIQSISTVPRFDAAKIEGFASTYFNGSPLFSLLGKDTGVVVESNPVGALDQLQIATDHFKDLRGKLFSNVAALTDSKTSDSKEPEMNTTVVSRTEGSVEVDHSAFAAKSFQIQHLNTCQWFQQLLQDLLAPEGSADQSNAAKATSSVSRVDSGNEDLQTSQELNVLKEADVSAPEEAYSLSAVDNISSMGCDSETRISVGDEVPIPTEGTVEVSSPSANSAYKSLEETDMRSIETVDDLLKYVDELFNPVVESDSSLRMPEWKSDAVSSPETHQNDMSLLSEGFPPVAVIGVLVAALAGAGLFVLSTRNTLPDTAGSTPQKIATSLVSPLSVAGEKLDKKSFSPMHTSTSPTTYSVHDTHIPDKHHLEAISSPFSSVRAQRNYGVQNLSTRFEMAELPTCSAPAVHAQSMSRVEEETSSVSAQTWHHPARIQEEYATKPFSYRQTATYVPSYSGMSTSWSAGETNSVAESALSTGADYNDLGSFTTSELISINEGGEEQKRMTPVRRSQRIRNKAVSPSPKLIF